MIAGHTLKLVLVDPPDDGEPMTLDLVRRRVASRLAGHRRARQRLASTPMNIATPAWIDDTSFDIRHHVRLASEPVDNRADLIAYAGKAMAERLDHLRPLWCMDFAGPLGRRPHGARDQDPSLHGRRRHRPAHALAAALGRRVGPGSRRGDALGGQGRAGTSRLLAAGVGTRMRDLGRRRVERCARRGVAAALAGERAASSGRCPRRFAASSRRSGPTRPSISASAATGAGLHVVRPRGPQARSSTRRAST